MRPYVPVILGVLVYVIVRAVYRLLLHTGPQVQRDWVGKYLVGAANAGFQSECVNMPVSSWQMYVHGLHSNLTSPNHIDTAVLERDIKLLKEMGGNTYRFSIKWARVQPNATTFHTSYYHDVCRLLRKYEIQPVITLFHFVLPPWAEDVWENRTGVFVTFACRAMLEFLQYKPVVITLNEPYLYALHSYMLSARPPFKRSCKLCLNVLAEMLCNHVQIYKFIKHCDPSVAVSIAKNIMPVHANTQVNPVEQILRTQFHTWFNLSYLRFVNTGVISMLLMGSLVYHDTRTPGSVDFVGVNHYTEMSMSTSLDYQSPIGVELRPPNLSSGSIHSAAGWFVTPLSWYKTLELVTKHTSLPILVTECGVSNVDNNAPIGRSDAMSNILSLINTFPQVCGVLVWTLIDNIEWESGNEVRFGIFDEQRRASDTHAVIKSFFQQKMQKT